MINYDFLSGFSSYYMSVHLWTYHCWLCLKHLIHCFELEINIVKECSFKHDCLQIYEYFTYISCVPVSGLLRSLPQEEMIMYLAGLSVFQDPVIFFLGETIQWPYHFFAPGNILVCPLFVTKNNINQINNTQMANQASQRFKIERNGLG